MTRERCQGCTGPRIGVMFEALSVCGKIMAFSMKADVMLRKK